MDTAHRGVITIRRKVRYPYTKIQLLVRIFVLKIALVSVTACLGDSYQSINRKIIKPPSHKLIGETENDTVSRMLQSVQVIGEGTDFLTIEVDSSTDQLKDAHLSALVLDKDRRPLLNVTSYPLRSNRRPSERLWIYFCFFSPRETPSHMRTSHYIKIEYSSHSGRKIEKHIRHHKQWGATDRARIFDLPSPPKEIRGVLILKDYVFLAEGDPRKPDGYYIESKIIAREGKWGRLEVLSDIKGTEPNMEIILETSRGWVELRDGRTHSMQEAVPPIPPYVKGWWDGKGYFHPDPIRVFY